MPAAKPAEPAAAARADADENARPDAGMAVLYEIFRRQHDGLGAEKRRLATKQRQTEQVGAGCSRACLAVAPEPRPTRAQLQACWTFALSDLVHLLGIIGDTLLLMMVSCTFQLPPICRRPGRCRRTRRQWQQPPSGHST